MPKKLLIALALGFSFLVYASFPNLAHAETVEITGFSSESRTASIGFLGMGGSSVKRTSYGIASTGEKRIVIRDIDGQKSVAFINSRGQESRIKASFATVDRAMGMGCLKLNIESDKLVDLKTSCEHSELQQSEEEQASDAS